MEPETVTVNGTVYDSRTGMPLRKERGHEAPHHHVAQKVHSGPQRSKTLNRRFVSLHDDKKETKVEVNHRTRVTSSAPSAISVHRSPSAAKRPTRSEHITKFAKSTQTSVKKRPVGADIAPAPHAVAIKAHQRVQQTAHHKPVETAIRPSQVIKQEAIEKALATSTPKAHKKEINQRKARSKPRKLMSVLSASLAVALLAGYFTYLNMPAISTRVAAAQAGIDAGYPGYHPSGYSLSGPVAYEQGSVTMKFAANSGPQSYTLTQSDSDWDSSAVLENSVIPDVGNEYTTTTTSGLTIYHYGNKAVWVNKGILYTVSGSDNLSNDQVQNIATSL